MGRLVFPIAIGMSEDGGHLFVANSNFDLRYNSGSLQSYDLEVLNAGMSPCQSVAPSERDSCGISPSEDDRNDLTDTIRPVDGLLVDQVIIGSYADGMAVAPYGDVSRIYMPVRSDANLTFVDVVDGRFDCGDTSGLGRECDRVFRSGDDESASLRDIQLPADPVGVTVGPLSDIVTGGTVESPGGNYVLFAHRNGRASLFFDQPQGDQSAPVLVHTLSGLPQELVDIALNPRTRLAWVPSALDPVVGRVGIAFDGATSEPERSYLFNAGNVFLSGIDTGSAARGDTRIIRFDPRPNVERAYILARRPRALLMVDTTDRTNIAPVVDLVEIGFGPSRLELATFADPNRTLAFISCFDSRDLYVIDVDLGRLVGIVRGLGGPFELTVDVARERVYILDFRTSVLRVIDLEPMLECLRGNAPDDGECSPRLLGIVGRPSSVQELR